MIETSRFGDPERGAKLNKLDGALMWVEQHVHFVALVDAVDETAPRPGGGGGRNSFPIELMVRVLLIRQLLFPRDFKATTHTLANPDDHYWKIVDCAKLLAKIDPSFVDGALQVYGKKLSDYSA